MKSMDEDTRALLGSLGFLGGVSDNPGAGSGTDSGSDAGAGSGQIGDQACIAWSMMEQLGFTNDPVPAAPVQSQPVIPAAATGDGFIASMNNMPVQTLGVPVAEQADTSAENGPVIEPTGLPAGISLYGPESKQELSEGDIQDVASKIPADEPVVLPENITLHAEAETPKELAEKPDTGTEQAETQKEPTDEPDIQPEAGTEQGESETPEDFENSGMTSADAAALASIGDGTVPPDENEDNDGRIIKLCLPDILGKSYLNYAMSVIVARALPDVRDGFKPVHRRILYSMYKMGLTYNTPYKKCATTVGDVLGHYHPHGDASVYDALVRLAQDFSMRYPLVDGHGNFGSMDGDPPAAYRYSEARLSRISGEMLRDIDKDTVAWNDNFDNTLQEPAVLPSRFPNILANGSQGIAVGMACNIPPHNLRELMDGCMMILDHDAAGEPTTVDDLLTVIHGPDFPTGATILGNSWREVYHTGKGRVELEAVYHMEHEKKSKKPLIVFTEIPYQVNKGGDSKNSLMNEIVRYVKSKKLDVADVRDESSREGVRIVVELKKSALPELVLNNLLQHTKLRSTFSAQMLMLVDGKPELLSLDRILRYYLDYQLDLIRRRTVFEKAKAEKRRHILEGLLTAVAHIDEIVQIIRTADDPAAELRARFDMSDEQVQAVLDIRLRTLQKMESSKLDAELREKIAEISRCVTLLSSPVALAKLLRDEIEAIGRKYGDERRTGHKDAVDDFTADDLVLDEPCVLMRTDMGYVKRMKPDAFRLQKKGGRGSKVATVSGDNVVDVVSASTLSHVFFFTSLGRVYDIRAYRIPETVRTARGTALASLLQKLQPGEGVTGMTVTNGNGEGQYLMIATRGGVVKRVELSDLPQNIRANGIFLIKLDEGDVVCDTIVVSDDDQALLVTRNGCCGSYPVSLVRAVGRAARGVKAMKLADGDEVAAMVRRKDGTDTIIVTESGFAKRVAPEDMPVYKSRNIAGVQCIKPSDRDRVGLVACVVPVDPGIDTDSKDLVMTCDNGQVIRTPMSSVPVYGRRARGSRMMRLNDPGIKVISAVITDRIEESEADVNNDEPVPDLDEEAVYEAAVIGTTGPDDPPSDAELSTDDYEEPEITLDEFAETVELDDHGNPILDDSWI